MLHVLPEKTIWAPGTGVLYLNWLPLILSMLLLPLLNLAGTLFSLPSALPTSSVLGATTVAYPLLYIATSRLLPLGRHLALITLICLWCALVATVLVADPGFDIASFLIQFTESAVFVTFCVAAAWYLLRRSTSFQPLLAFIAGTAGIWFNSLLMIPALVLMIRHTPIVIDPILYYLDHLIGIGDTTPVALLLRSNRMLASFTEQAYWWIGEIIILAAISEARHAPARLAGLYIQFLVATVLGFALYFFLPAVGVAYFFNAYFPLHMPPIDMVWPRWVEFPVQTPRNAMPSLHATWAIFCLLALRYSPLWHRVLGVLVVSLMVLATLGLGEHYASDWLVALPLILLTRGLCALTLNLTNGARLSAISLGTVLLLGWLFLIWLAPNSLDTPWVVRGFCAASIWIPFVTERRLARVERAVVLSDDKQSDNPPTALRAAVSEVG